jgi:hypothetical protein
MNVFQLASAGIKRKKVSRLKQHEFSSWSLPALTFSRGKIPIYDSQSAKPLQQGCTSTVQHVTTTTTTAAASAATAGSSVDCRVHAATW